jgi:uncharacterized protein
MSISQNSQNPSTPSLERIRRAAISQTLLAPSTLQNALNTLRYVQADPIRAPARAQDLILRHRVQDYRAGDLERLYPTLEIEEDAVQNYGFVTRELQSWLHPRHLAKPLQIEREVPHLPEQVLEFVTQNGPSHPKALERHFGRTSVGNYWGGSSNATTRVLEALHYRGALRVSAREKGIKIYETAQPLESGLSPLECAQKLLELILNLHAPLPEKSLGQLVSLLGYGAPHLKNEMKIVLAQFKKSCPQAKIEGVNYLWQEDQDLGQGFEQKPLEGLRFLAPFDPIVWDRRRFEHLFGWEYKFEAYVPAAKRKWGYYALPMLWGETVIGWGNFKWENKLEGNTLISEIGYLEKPPSSLAFKEALEAELVALEQFLQPLS